ncbi:pro-sigmaK processing inhibitor BofA family protein [Desulfallas sp. Bu1-1]|uniref:pro-sigmaK processing inhibitor BofA family protein n=1 Tax=Desulfallas sp. Bu1-1 TaxID=2787620 RepID=UPI00189F0D03|nr:pro-sigmaK processing inhibitor BofA family protein [Desulfallas sp. Bu1-1]MBF7084171.1 pro-sigmaK processing inhibitor BofA family protein [Desulfallas sp. Bu1-1]
MSALEWNLLVIGLAVLLGLYIVVTLFYKPLGLLVRLFVCAITGVVLLSVFNFILGYVGLHVAFNPFTVLVAGILQLPGLIMLLVLTHWFI